MKAIAISVDPLSIFFGFIIPSIKIQRIQMQHISLPIPGDQVQGAGHPDRLFVEVYAKNLQDIQFVIFRDFFIGE